MKYQVDTRAVRKIQSSLWAMITKTFDYRKGMAGEPLPVYGHYGGIFRIGSENLVIHADGVGTKVLVAQELGKYDTVGVDAVAMNSNDIICLGAEPMVGVDYIALAKEDDFLVSEIMKGLVKGCEESKCALIGGETAVIPELIKGGERPFDLSFTMVGRIVSKEIITGSGIKSGDIIIGLESSGLHSNGYTLARKALDSKKWGKEMLVPTRIYVKPLLDAMREVEIHGLAHITGGAFSKLTRLNKGVGFVLDNVPKLSPIFEELYRKVGDRGELYRTFNCGVGMAIVAPHGEENKIRAIMKRHGVGSSVIGRIDDEKTGVILEHEEKRIDLTIQA